MRYYVLREDRDGFFGELPEMDCRTESWEPGVVANAIRFLPEGHRHQFIVFVYTGTDADAEIITIADASQWLASFDAGCIG